MSSETIELTELPGLESPEPRSELQPGHFIERGTQRRLMLFAGTLAPGARPQNRPAPRGRLRRGQLKTFANGEGYCRFEESIRGADVFLVQTGSRAGGHPSWSSLHGPGRQARVGEANHRRHAAGSRTRVRTARPGRASRSAPASSRTFCRQRAPTAC